MDPQAVETERYRSELAEVRAELEPWEKQLIEHKGKLEVACTERKLLTEKVMLVICIEIFDIKDHIKALDTCSFFDSNISFPHFF